MKKLLIKLLHFCGVRKEDLYQFPNEAEKAAAQFQGFTIREVDQQGWHETPVDWFERMEQYQPPKNRPYESQFCECIPRCTCCGKLVKPR